MYTPFSTSAANRTVTAGRTLSRLPCEGSASCLPVQHMNARRWVLEQGPALHVLLYFALVTTDPSVPTPATPTHPIPTALTSRACLSSNFHRQTN